MEIPRLKPAEVELDAPFLMETHHRRRDPFLNGAVEAQAVFRRIVEALELLPAIGAVVGEAGDGCLPLPDLQQAPPEVVDRAAIPPTPLSFEPPGAFACPPLWILVRCLKGGQSNVP